MATCWNEHLYFLQARLPVWLTKLSTITQEAENRQVEAPETSLRTPSQDECNDVQEQPQSPDTPRQSTFAVYKASFNDTLQVPHSAKRKRRSSSFTSHHKSDINSYRAQNAKVVLYDSSAQKVLEEVVDGIALAKNKIRQAKAQARMQSWSRQVPVSDDDDEDDEYDDDTVMGQVRMRCKRTSEAGNISSSEGSSTNVESLDKIDRHLGRAQDMCRCAAYQLLRDGDCRTETSQAAEQLEDVCVFVGEGIGEGSNIASLDCASVCEKEMTSTTRQGASVDSEKDVPLTLTAVCVTPKLSPH